MFNLSRYFSTVSFILVVLAAGVLGPLYQKLSMQQLQDLTEGRNVAMAQVFQNSQQGSLASLMSQSTGRDAAHIRDSDEASNLGKGISELMQLQQESLCQRLLKLVEQHSQKLKQL